MQYLSKRRVADQLGDMGSNHMHAHNIIGITISYYLHKSFLLSVNERFADRRERDFSNLYADPFILRFSLRQTYGCHLRPSVYTARNMTGIITMRRLSG
ncbi:hypothetical protein D3C77_448460 [compost metagenome]